MKHDHNMFQKHKIFRPRDPYLIEKLKIIKEQKVKVEEVIAPKKPKVVAMELKVS